MNKEINSPGDLEKRLMDWCIARKEDLLPFLKKEMVSQGREMVWHRKCLDRAGPLEMDRLARPQGPETNSCSYRTAPQTEEVEQTPAEDNARFRSQNSDLAPDEHPTMNQ